MIFCFAEIEAHRGGPERRSQTREEGDLGQDRDSRQRAEEKDRNGDQ